ncbi:alpha/beta hydrolase [Shewanella subflava]|uniref:Alpha/beta hydrolase-fold protein n=1 Tax=Shewanella subflava TaxID=2986476 RepID=A0ABT3I8Q8_9GAMM|nr:alpha/beta hydrolase-fold protein [Shewanella subflava]MCW3172459.1 alpha/beta hydrolase-fold protein [Shewanella subflava]
MTHFRFQLILVSLLWGLFSRPIDANPLPPTEALTYGHVYQHDSITFAQPRRFMVSLPERYFASDRQFPVLYVIDGDFQFQHVSAAVNNLARMGKTPPMIVVGVAIQGPEDYLMSTTWPSEIEGSEFGGAAQLQAYLTHELVPLIDKQFRTTDAKALSGYSLGGLFTLYSMMQQSTPFNAFMAFSPSAWYDEYAINQKFIEYLQDKKTVAPLFISLANEQGMGVNELVATINQHAPNGWQAGFASFANETHYSTAMPSILAGLAYLAPDYYTDLDQLLEMSTYQQVFDHFQAKQSQWAGFRFEWLQAYNLIKYLFISKQTDKIDEVLLAANKRFPESYSELCIGFAKGFIKKQQPEVALKVLMSAKEDGVNSADWHQQVSESQQLLGHAALALEHHQQALNLAKKHQLASWEYWELKP